MPSSRITNLPFIRVWQQSVTVAGTAEKLGVKIIASTISFTSNGAFAPDTIADSANGFLAAGFRPGDQITITGATNAGNNATFTIGTVTAGLITLAQTAALLTTETAGSSVKIFAPVVIPDGVGLTMKAKYANGGNIYVGHAATSAKSTGFTMRNNESVSVQVIQSDLLFIDAAVSGEGVECIVEQQKNSGE